MARDDFWGELIGDGFLLIISMALGSLAMFLLHLTGVSTPMPQVLIGIGLGSFLGLMMAKYVQRKRSGSDGA